jgi:hypothetical protein
MFYILTCGSTASKWLSRVLSLHPEIVCFHGVKRLAAVSGSARTDGLARQFVRDLEHLYWAAQGEQVFGAIHGFAAAEIVPEMAAASGTLLANIRHPITRLNSLFHRQCEEVIRKGELPGDDIYRPFRENEQALAQPAPDQARLSSPLAPYVQQFEALCANALAEDTFILDDMNREDVFQYERMVADPEYFRAFFERLADGCRHFVANSTRRGAIRLEYTRDYVDRVFKLGVVNRKNTGVRQAEAIVAKWPRVFNTIFARQLRHQGGKKAVDRYAEFGYDLPSDVHESPCELPASDLSQRRRGPAKPILHDFDYGTDRALAAAETPSQTAPGPDSGVMTPADSSSRLKQMLAVIDMERADRTDQLRRLQEASEAEREIVAARIRELQNTLNAERGAFRARIQELQDTLDGERRAFRTRTQELQDTMDGERRAFRARIQELQDTLDGERRAFAARIKKLEGISLLQLARRSARAALGKLRPPPTNP